MSEEDQTQTPTDEQATDRTAAQPADQAGSQSGSTDTTKLDPAFFTCVNEYLELTNRQSKTQGLKRISMASVYAAARFNAHVYLSTAGQDVAADRTRFLDYMSTMYRRMLNEHLDGLGHERGINVGESELAADYAAARAAAAAADSAQPAAPAVPATE